MRLDQQAANENATHYLQLEEQQKKLQQENISLNKTLTAGIIGIILVVITLVVLYHFSGFIAGVSLMLYTLKSPKIMKILRKNQHL